MDGEGKRRHHRIKFNYFIKFCREGERQKWDMSPIRDLSEGGVLFYATGYYAPGSMIDMSIYYSQINPEKICKGMVIRCDKVDEREGLHKIVVDITQLDQDIKKALYAAIENSLKEKKK